ncbi:VOC family protein [Jannaschia sp. S6380]|uniref:VOC family protein n=1 Tax=Jannaschia sp. S6380 TaxID=2926408 RepID=UPI001FF26E91|nr:VOC family protein [Jannaschia sp. S6380]MCK0167589.1 VOC family protein [Jannaschia sp. S6380]
MRVEALDHLVLTVADPEATAEWYRTVLGMRIDRFDAADGTRRTALAFGRQKINLHRAGAEFEPKAARPGPGSADLCFLTDMPLGEWQDHLRRQAVAIEDGPVARTGAQGPITSLYVRDPDGNLIEIATLD